MEVNYEGYKRTPNARFCPGCDTRLSDHFRGRVVCHECRLLLTLSETHEVRAHNDAVARTTREYHQARLRALGAQRQASPVRLTPDGVITVKCDTRDCKNYYPPELMTRTKVSVLITDPEKADRKIPVLRDADLCPHCFAGSDPGLRPYERSAHTVEHRLPDRRSAAEIDPDSYELLRRRYRR